MTAMGLDQARLVAGADGSALAADARAAEMSGRPVVALVGRPNVGKSTFLGRVSGGFEETANVPGTTIDVTRREVAVAGRDAILVDLPGTYGLTDRSDGIPVFWELLLDARPDAILAVVDAGDIGRHLPLVLACRDLGVPVVVAANLSDEAAARGITLDTGRLSQLLATPVVRTVGRRGEGVERAMAAAIDQALEHRDGRRTAAFLPPYPPAVQRSVRALSAGDPPPVLRRAVEAGRVTAVGAATVMGAAELEPHRWEVAERWARQVVTQRDVPLTVSERLGRIVTRPWPGLPLFAGITIGVLLLTMLVGTWLATILAEAWAAFVSPGITAVIGALVPVPALASALLWALDSGLLAMLSVGIPFVLCFYLLLATLEDSGYLATTAVLTDRVFNTLGLPGRAAIPVLAATGCNVPAVYGTRVLDTRRERSLAAFLIVLTPCSARSAVVIAALAPFAGPGVALAAFGVVAALTIAAGVAANALVPGTRSPMILELPPLRRPVARQVVHKAWYRFRSFVRMAAPVMLVGSFVVGLLYETGAVAAMGDLAAPVTTGLLGLPPVVGIALALGFLRKELALQLLIVFAVAAYGASATDLSTFLTDGQLFVFAIVTAISIPCVATLTALADELGWRAAGCITGGALGLALLAGAIVARVLGVA
jgi:ferrous iron transport protein B